MRKRKTQTNKKFILGTLYQWALASFIIVTLPLIFSIVYTVFEVAKYNEKSIQTLFQTLNITQGSRNILERLTSMERSIRQFKVLNEPDLLQSYKEHRQKFLDALQSQTLIIMDQNIIVQLQNLQKHENQLFQKIEQNIKNNQLELTKTDLTAFDQLTKQAGKLLTEGEKKVGIEANILSATAKQVVDKLIYYALASISFALILGFIFVNLLSKPIKKIGQAIRNFGEIGFEQPISIQGPYDLTELGEHLEWLRQKLNRVEYEKQQFIRNVSHELKTPLATLKEGTDLLAENVVGELNTEQQEIIQLMKIGNITIHDLVENLLEYQRTLSTQIEINATTFYFNFLIERIANEYQLLLRSKKITLNSNLNTCKINADYDKLKIIISNLLSNALKFSSSNGVIGLTLTSTNNVVQFIIEDQGPGIDKEIQPHIFKPFYQGISSPGWKIKPSGLGLALVKHYLEAHQGSISLLDATPEYCGTRFSLKLPHMQKTNDATII